jgi:hypothetical protein
LNQLCSIKISVGLQKKSAMDLNKILANAFINLKANKSLNLIRSKTNFKKQTMHISKSLIMTFKIQLSSWINNKNYKKSTPKMPAMDIRKTKAIVTTKLSKKIMKGFR